MKIKSILAATLAAVLFITTFTCCADASKDGTNRSEMTALDYAKEMGIGINIGNTLESFWEDTGNKVSNSQIIGDGSISNYETCWGAIVTTKEMIDGIRNEGFNTVRIPVYWGNGMSASSDFKINKDLLDRVEELVGWCIDDGLYVVVNIHHYDEFIVKNYSEDDALKIIEKLWKQIAERFKDYSDYLVFEGFNENVGTVRESDSYSDDQKFEYANQLNQTFVDAVRSTGGNNSSRVLIVSGYNTNIDKTTDSRFKMPKDSAKDRLMISVHYADNSVYWSNQIGSQWWLDYTKQQCDLLKKAFTDKGIPVFMGECTSNYPTDRIASSTVVKGGSPAFLETILRTELDYGFVPVLWDTHSDSSFYSRTDCRIRDDSNREVIKKLIKEFDINPTTHSLKEEVTITPPVECRVVFETDC